MEMNIRLLSLDFLLSTIGVGNSIDEQAKRLVRFIERLEKRMDDDALENAKSDKKRLEMLLDKGIVGYIRRYFKEKKITTYDEFVNIVKRENVPNLTLKR